MANVTLSQEDVRAAEAFLEGVLVEAFPDADFSKGSATRDHVIGALAMIVGVMRGEATRIRYATSFDSIGLLQSADERLAAARALAANWFITPKTGTRVRGVVTLHFSQRVSGKIATTTVFAKTSGIRFKLDQSTAYLFDAADMLPNLSVDGSVTDYILRVPVIAEFVGNAFAISEGVFAAVTAFNAAFTYAENEEAFATATEPETAEQLRERVADAITVRDLNSARSINAVLREEFPEVSNVYVAGMGQPEQRRDIYDLAGARTQFHLGGHTDVYVSLPVATERVFQGVVGAQFIDARTAITAFRDPTVRDMRSLVSVGDVLRIYNALASEPRLYLITQVYKDYVRVQRRQPFPAERPMYSRNAITFNTGIITAPDTLTNVNAQFVASDVGRYIRVTRSVGGNAGTYQIIAVNTATSSVTLNTNALVSESTPDFDFEIYENVVEYSIGTNDGVYDDKVSHRFTGEFTRRISESGVLVLPQDPLYLIRSVKVLNAADVDADPLTGEVEFPVRKNVVPVRASGDQLQYFVSADDPELGHSAQQLSTLRLGWAPYLTGTQASVNTSGVLTASSAVFTDADVGATLRLVNAFWPDSRGDFEIQSRINGTQVQLIDPANPSWSPQSERRLSWELGRASKYDGFVCRVTYDTVAGFSGVSSYVADDLNRVSCANTVVKAYSPVYLSFDIRYRLRRNAETTPDEDAIRSAMVSFVNTYPTDDTIDVSDIVTAFHNTNPDLIGNVELPLTITYTLFAPDGRYIPYATQDMVTIDVNKSTAVTPDEILTDPLSLGISDQTVRYLTTTSLITITRIT